MWASFSEGHCALGLRIFRGYGEGRLGLRCNSPEGIRGENETFSSHSIQRGCAQSLGVRAIHGTADILPYDDSSFDIVIFGFCLCWCDREDLFRIVFEADRVLKDQGWLIVHDFYSPMPIRREYHHKAGVYSFKMDYRRLFDWHPGYICFSHEINHLGKSVMTDDVQKWVATSVMRKNMKYA